MRILKCILCYSDILDWLCFPNPPYNTKEAISNCGVFSVFKNPGLVRNWRPKIDKRCILKCIGFSFGPGLHLLWLLSQSEAVYHHVDSENQRNEKRSAVCKERGDNWKWVGFQILRGAECACITLTTLRSRTTATSRVLTQRWDKKSTHREKWLVTLQLGGFTPSVQLQYSF